jgi:formyl-CoA transferase
MMLGDLGADVIKIEQPGRGDDSRAWGPPFVGEPGIYPGESAYFLCANRNKRSVTLNMKAEQGRAVLKKLAAVSDVVVENYKRGDLDKMGVGYAALSAINPRLVWASINGYGPAGPDADRPGYDFVVQAEGGLMSLNGPEDGAPYKVGVPIVDITSGMFAAYAILAGLRARDLTGRGQKVDLSLFETQLAWLANVGSNYLIGGNTPKRYANAHPNVAPYDAFKARDRHFALAVGNDMQFKTFCGMIGRPELATDPRFAQNAGRVSNRHELTPLINKALAGRDADEWMQLLRAAGVPCAPINTVPEAFAHPQAAARDMILQVEHPTAGTIKLAGFPYKFSDTPASVRMPPPLLGQHTQEVLVELLGYSPDDVQKLREQGAI